MATAQDTQLFDQFYAVSKPFGIELAPRDEDARTRALTYKPKYLSIDQLAEFARAICKNGNATFETQSQSWRQWFKGTVEARITC